MSAKTTKPETDLRHLRDFVAATDAVPVDVWNRELGDPPLPCRFGKRLSELGYLTLVRAACQSSAGFMGGAYHPATYRVTLAGRQAAQ